MRSSNLITSREQVHRKSFCVSQGAVAVARGFTTGVESNNADTDSRCCANYYDIYSRRYSDH